jgi:NDP-sugar pyrophosphorylase family protein
MPTLFKKIIKKKIRTISFPLGEYWLDIGRFNDFKKANDEYKLMF